MTHRRNIFDLRGVNWQPWVENTTVYQAGRGSEPMIEVGSAISADALYIASLSLLGFAQKSKASLLAATFFTSARSGSGSGAPESRKRLTMG
jgi:hypothetical protein